MPIAKPSRRRVYLFMTRQNGEAVQVLVFSHSDPSLWAGVQTPGGTVELHESPLQAALREANEETGLTLFGTAGLLVEDDFENDEEVLRRFFFHLPVLEATSDAWTHRVYGEGADGGMEFDLRWVDLPEAPGLAPHFRAYIELVRVSPS